MDKKNIHKTTVTRADMAVSSREIVKRRSASMKKGLFRLDLRDDRLGRVKHERLKTHLVNEMIAGRLKPGQALPSESEFSKTLGITRVTVRQAMASLENDGLIRRVQGKGNYVEENAQGKLRRGLDIFALVVPDTRRGFYPSLLNAFGAAASAIHHQTIVCCSDTNEERQAAIVLQLMDKGVGGVALNPVGQLMNKAADDVALNDPMPVYQVRQLRERGIPVVFLHHRIEGITAPALTISNYEVGHMAGKAFAEHGHQRAAMFTAIPNAVARARESGLREGLQAGNRDIYLQSVYAAESNVAIQEERLLAALQQVFAEPHPPTAICTTFDTMAEMIYLLLPRLGLRVPEDVSLVGFGGAWREGAITQRLTSVVVDEEAVGRLAVRWLHEMRSGNRPLDDNTEVVVGLSISEGRTLAVAPEKR
jgi:GntR family transcriptional regulator, arabinose operon transcriptional repressor